MIIILIILILTFIMKMLRNKCKIKIKHICFIEYKPPDMFNKLINGRSINEKIYGEVDGLSVVTINDKLHYLSDFYIYFLDNESTLVDNLKKDHIIFIQPVKNNNDLKEKDIVLVIDRYYGGHLCYFESCLKDYVKGKLFLNIHINEFEKFNF